MQLVPLADGSCLLQAFAGAANGFRPAGDTGVGNDVGIGDGAMIGTRAVVTHDVAPYAILAGNPAKKIRKRFDPQQIALLLALRWWDWSAAALPKQPP